MSFEFVKHLPKPKEIKEQYPLKEEARKVKEKKRSRVSGYFYWEG